MTVPVTHSLPLDVALQQAVAHHQAGRLPEAEQLYRAILQAQPGQPDANHNLGVLACQVGQPAAGLCVDSLNSLPTNVFRWFFRRKIIPLRNSPPEPDTMRVSVEPTIISHAFAEWLAHKEAGFLFD